MLSQSPQQVKISPTHASQGNGRSGNGLLNTVLLLLIVCTCRREEETLMEILDHYEIYVIFILSIVLEHLSVI